MRWFGWLWEDKVLRKYLVKSWVVLCWLPALAAWHIIKGWKVEVGCSLILKYQILLILIFTTKLNLNSAHEDENFKLSLHTTERSPTFTSTAFSCTQHLFPMLNLGEDYCKFVYVLFIWKPYRFISLSLAIDFVYQSVSFFAVFLYAFSPDHVN